MVWKKLIFYFQKLDISISYVISLLIKDIKGSEKMSEYVSVDYEDYSNKAIKFYVFLKNKALLNNFVEI